MVNGTERIGPLTDKTRPDMDDLQQSLTKAGVINAFAKKYEDADGRPVLLAATGGTARTRVGMRTRSSTMSCRQPPTRRRATRPVHTEASRPARRAAR